MQNNSIHQLSLSKTIQTPKSVLDGDGQRWPKRHRWAEAPGVTTTYPPFCDAIVVRAKLVKSGNSRGIRLAKPLLEVVTAETVSMGDIFLVAVNPTRGSEIRKTRPCVVVSPDDLNAHLRTFIVAPLTTGGHHYPFRVPCRFEDKDGHVVADQLRAVDRDRLVKRLGILPDATLIEVLSVLQAMFAE